MKKIHLFHYFSGKRLIFVYQIFDNKGSVKFWSGIKEEFVFKNLSNFTWQQLIYALPPLWKKIKETDNAHNLLLPNHHRIKKTIGIEKLISRHLYSLLVYTHPYTQTSFN